MTTTTPTQTFNRNTTTPSAREILSEGNGKGLIKFCRELALLLVKQSAVQNDPTKVRSQLMTSIRETLDCDSDQADSLVELSLEMIHQKTHGCYQRSPLDLSYLMAKATGMVNDPAAN